MALYRFNICATDGSTPLGESITVEFEGADQYEARSKMYAANPGYDVVSCGLASEIDEWERRHGKL